jgi:hypothetical protein
MNFHTSYNFSLPPFQEKKKKKKSLHVALLWLYVVSGAAMVMSLVLKEN